MYFCSGSPRIYTAIPSLSKDEEILKERYESTTICMNSNHRFMVIVTSTQVALWATATIDNESHHPQRFLTSISRQLPERERENINNQTRVFALWVSNSTVVVAETGAQAIEIYDFNGLESLDLPNISAISIQADIVSGDPVEGSISGKFVGVFDVSQGNTEQETNDFILSLAGVPGYKYVYLGMYSGLISVVEVSSASGPSDSASTWFSSGTESTNTDQCRLWRIDILSHLRAHSGESAEENVIESCYALTCAAERPWNNQSYWILVACFENGKCLVMSILPKEKRVMQLLLLVLRDANAKKGMQNNEIASRCTSVELDKYGSRLALGWGEGSVSIFQIVKKFDANSKQSMTLEQHPKELTLTTWGYAAETIGPVSTLSWSLDARVLAVGYAFRGFAVFSLDGCRLMSTLPHTENAEGDVTNARRRISYRGERNGKEICASGVQSLAWTSESTSLMAVPRRFNINKIAQRVNLYDVVRVELYKGAGGLCLSLSGSPGRRGAWVHSDPKQRFPRMRDGEMGPAEASKAIEGGDLLLQINDDASILHDPFQVVVEKLKRLPTEKNVVLVFLRLKYDTVFPLAAQCLCSPDWRASHDIRLLPPVTGDSLVDGESNILESREFALRMQGLYGDAPESINDIDVRNTMSTSSQYEAWKIMRGTPFDVAKHKYLRLYFAVFPEWDPFRGLDILERGASMSETIQSQQSASQSLIAFDFARTLTLSSSHLSSLVLAEHHTIRLMSMPSSDDPSTLTSALHWQVPPGYRAHCGPLRIIAVSGKNRNLAVAGDFGFCVLHQSTGKWRMFGNIADERDMLVHALLWIRDDVIVACATKFSEKHQKMHLLIYPRNHLDESSILARDVVGENLFEGNNKDYERGVALTTNERQSHIYCLTKEALWCFNIQFSGLVSSTQSGNGSTSSSADSQFNVEIMFEKKVQLPRGISDNLFNYTSLPFGGVENFTVLPRMLHLQNQETEENSNHKRNSISNEQEDTNWLSSIVNAVVGGEVPNQYTPHVVLPRFAFLTAKGNVIVWDPETRAQRLLCSNISTMTRLFISNDDSKHWPTACRLMYGLYGRDGLRLWLPLLDGVYLTRSDQFESDRSALRSFLESHDPLRLKTYSIEFGTASATAELYEQVLLEYGLDLETFAVDAKGRTIVSKSRSNRNMLGSDQTITEMKFPSSVNEQSSLDSMIRFDMDVKLLGLESSFGLIVGVSQDVYVLKTTTSDVLPVYDLSTRVQPFFHTLLCYLVSQEQLSWAGSILKEVRGHYALSTATQELFLHSILESCYQTIQSQPDISDGKTKLMMALKLLQPEQFANSNEKNVDACTQEMDEYCEIVAHVARKSEPSRLHLLFPLAGKPLDLLNICRTRGELQTAANFLLILEEASLVCPVDESNASEFDIDEVANQRKAQAIRCHCAIDLAIQCIEQSEFSLAQHVVRVAREWEIPATYSGKSEPGIDEALSTFVWHQLFLRMDMDRLLWCLEQLNVSFPLRRNLVLQEPMDANVMEIESERLNQYFTNNNQLPHAHCLLKALVEAQQTQWIQLMKHVISRLEDM